MSAFQCSVKKGIRDHTFWTDGLVTLPMIVRPCFSFRAEISGSETQTLDFRGAGKCSSATALPLSEEDNLLCIAEVVQVGNQGLLLFR